MVCQIKTQVINRTYVASDIEVLESRGEAMVIVFHIEEVHCTVKLVVRAEDGAESANLVVITIDTTQHVAYTSCC